MSFLALMAHQVIELRQRLEVMKVRSAKERVLVYLDLNSDPDGRTVNLRSQLQDIASELGLSREDPYVNLSIHTAPDVRPFPWQSCQWAKSVGFTRRSRSNQSRAPLVFRRKRLNLRRAQRMT